MRGERATIEQVRKNRWNRQRNEAIQREQVERCYKWYVPPQIRFAELMVRCGT